MEMTGYRPGTPSWVDLGSPDPAAAARFYGELFGWTAEPGPGDYRVCRLRGRAVAGIGTAQEPGRPRWATYMSVADADTVAKLVRDHGGEVLLEPMDVLDAGRTAVFTDPAGAPFSVWQPGELIGAGIVNEPGAMTWNELRTRDTEGAMRFYAAVFGWEPQTHGRPPYTMWHVDGQPVGGMIAMDGDWPADAPARWTVYFAVADADATAARAIELGGSVQVAPAAVEVGRFAALCDPHGAAFSVIALSRG